MSEDQFNPGSGALLGYNNLYQRMIEEIQDYAIIVLDKNGFIRNWNKGAQKIKQYTEQEILGQHFSVFYLPYDVQNNLPQRLLNEAKETGRAVHEGWRVRKDGSKFWGSITITAIHDPNNEVIGFCKVTRDLTERKIAEDNLRMSEQRYHQMVAEVQDYAIILLSPEGVIENWNVGAEKIKGYTAREVVGKKFELFYTEEDRRAGLPYILLDRARKEGKAVQEGWRVRKDGSRFWGTIVITALHHKEGDVIGFSKVTRDLTAQKEAEVKLSEYMAELEIQNSELEQFAYVASHDLQEPLRKIQTFADLIQEHIHDTEFVQKYLQKLDKSATRMSALIKSLLNYSRLGKGQQGVEPVDLNELLGEIEVDFELMIQEKQAVIKSAELPTISCNRIQIGQLLANLISNSLKFCETQPLITINYKMVSREKLPDIPSHAVKENFHELSVEDNGIGFDPQYTKVIFSLFHRLHGKQDYAGTGIGLALCKKIAENHGGFITASSETGKGAIFKVYLPA